jgi:hypothetical protein
MTVVRLRARKSTHLFPIRTMSVTQSVSPSPGVLCSCAAVPSLLQSVSQSVSLSLSQSASQSVAQSVSLSLSKSVHRLAYSVVVLLWPACCVAAVPGGDTVTRKSGWIIIVRWTELFWFQWITLHPIFKGQASPIDCPETSVHIFLHTLCDIAPWSEGLSCRAGEPEV